MMQKAAFRSAVLMVFMIPWEGAIAIEGVGTMARIIGLVVAALWATTVVRRFGARRPDPFHLAALLFVLWNVVSLYWTIEVDLTVQRVLTLTQLLAFAYILWDLTNSPRALRALLQAYVLGAYVSIGSATANLIRGDDVRFRYTGARMDENELALILALGLPVAWLLATSSTNGKLKQLLTLMNYAYLPCAIFTIVLTGSRMGLFAVIPAALFVFGSLPRLRLPSRIVVSTALAATFLVLYPHVPPDTLERLTTIGASITSADLGGRVAIWREGVRSFVKHPIVGVGGGAFVKAVPRLQAEAHNIFLSIAVELGIMGLALFAIMLTIAGYKALKQPRWLSRFWVTVLVTWGIGVTVLTFEHRKATWLYLGLMTVGAGLHGRHGLAAVQEPSEVSPSRS